MIAFCSQYAAYFAAIAFVFAMFGAMICAIFWCVCTAIDKYMTFRTIGKAFRRCIYDEARKQSRNEAILDTAMHDPKQAEMMMDEGKKD
jgi:hypothetical protein